MNAAGLQDIIQKMTGCSFHESRMDGTRRTVGTSEDGSMMLDVFDIELTVVRLRDAHGRYENTNIDYILSELQSFLGKEARITLHVRG